MDFRQLDEQLRGSLVDFRLDQQERSELRELGDSLRQDQLSYLRNRAFDLVREGVLNTPEHTLSLLKWLEQVVRTLDAVSSDASEQAFAYFSPGESCRRKIIELCRQTRESLDICVFTISDDNLTEEVIAAYKRGVTIRLVTDNDKQYDEGSDIERFEREGIPVRVDGSPMHMHHKFAIFDRKWLLNGSFNWTRSATDYNAENLLVTSSAALLKAYQKAFDTLWEKYAP